MRQALAAALALAAPSQALAGAWPAPRGETQAIAKVEWLRAEHGYDTAGVLRPLPGPREDRVASLYVEHGLTERVTFQFKGEWQQGRDAFVDYADAGPTEIGLRWAAWRGETAAISLYAGYAVAGEGRNAGYAAPGAGDGDWEVRLLAGRSGRVRRLGDMAAFVDFQVARRMREALPDEARADLTIGLEVAPDWTVLLQGYGGQVLDGGEAAWANGEASLVRRFGDWRLQVGWRQHLAGIETPAQSGPVFAVWRRF